MLPFTIKYISRYTLILANLMFAPILIKKARWKIKEIQSSENNDSFSTISVYILKVVIVTFHLVEIYLMIVTAVYIYVNFWDYDSNVIIFIEKYILYPFEYTIDTLNNTVMFL